ncbi:hypothetical protein [Demequina sp. NBRC 110052]|uniref:hypothetical protein n=1 Tax=Demequina sp. NBRC 110052 TaxID=1570341 RepID=UPI00117CFD2E|nr:hypothetical protein [Demequina sp. NBRC 110052]
MTSADTRAGLRLLAGTGLAGGSLFFGVPAAFSTTWGVVGHAASQSIGGADMTVLVAWLLLGILALLGGGVALAIASRRRRAARTGMARERRSELAGSLRSDSAGATVL